MRFIIPLIISVATFYNASALTNQPAMPPTPVELMKVKQVSLTHGVLSTAELTANRSITLKSEIPGKIAVLNLPEGKVITAGTVLIELENAVTKANLAQAIARHEQSQIKYNRLQALAQKGIGSLSDRDEAQGNLRFEEASVNLAKAQLEKTKLKAPFTGILGLRHVDIGDYIDPGQALINLEDISSLLVDFRVPEKFLMQLKAGQTIEVTLEAIPNTVFEGTIFAINPQIDPATRTISARASMPNVKELLRPGLFAKVKVVFSKNPHALVVPEQAVFNVKDKSFIYLVKDNKALLTEIKTGSRENAQVEVIEGLNPNDTIVHAGRMRLFNGADIIDIQSQKK